MGAGAQFARERDRWPLHWRVRDTDRLRDELLAALGPDEDLTTVVPGVLVGVDVLVGRTGRRWLVATAAGCDTARIGPTVGPDGERHLHLVDGRTVVIAAVDGAGRLAATP